MRVLYIGGTGEVSYGCIQASIELGHETFVFNRGTSSVTLPAGARHIVGDVTDPASYAALGRQSWDAVCQFRTFSVADAERDVETFGGATQQFVFISTASAYQKPPRSHRITEATPLANPFSEYSRNKALAEAYFCAQHAAGRLPVTIVRPSHTNRVNFPGTFISGDHIAWRMLNGKAVVSHGDGSGLWVLTRSEDFGAAFARLLGNPRAMGEAFHITSDEANPWDRLFAAMADALGVEANLVHVATDTLIQYNAAWESGLRGDKAWSVQFDNSKIKQAVDGCACRYSMCDAMRMAATHVQRRMQDFQPDLQVDALVDRIVAEQRTLK